MNQQQIKGGLKFTPPAFNKGGMNTKFNPANITKLQQGFKKLADGDNDGIPDIFEAMTDEVAGKVTPFGRAMSFRRSPCQMKGQRGTLLKRPVIPLRIRVSNLSIGTGSGILAQLIASTGWNNAGSVALSASNNARTLLSREADPNKFYSVVQHTHLRYVKPFVRVIASSPGQAVDKDLSEAIRTLILSNLVVVLDPDGKGKNLALAPVYFDHLTARGIELADDQVFEFLDNSVLRFDYNGVGEQGGQDSSYALADHTPQAACVVSVIIGFDVIVSENPGDDVGDMIERVEGLA